ncbi:phage tail tube protein [Prosthecochloris sp.]|uniref:phage tail tube protein n=1 Tax=Prosthecochloris sp. TaxID=290513 RepID=UPI00257B222C|nr:phage tail tube protein [Prosthecochloris sp.]
MAEQLGRNLVLVKGSSGGTGGTAIAGVRTKGIAVNNAPVDVSSDDSSGWRKLLDTPGEKTIDFSVSGVATDRTALAAAVSASDVVDEWKLTWEDGADVYGDCFIASYSETGEYNGTVTFEMSLQSAGAITYQAGS